MSALKKEWSKEDIARLDYDIKVAKVKVFEKHGFTAEEIGRVFELPESIITRMLDE